MGIGWFWYKKDKYGIDKDDISTGNDGGESVDYLHISVLG